MIGCCWRGAGVPRRLSAGGHCEMDAASQLASYADALVYELCGLREELEGPHLLVGKVVYQNACNKQSLASLASERYQDIIVTLATVPDANHWAPT